jgi:hypothetical protein
VEKSADVASLIGLKPNQCHVKGWWQPLDHVFTMIRPQT